MVAPALDYNPRRIKQFINLFRLRTFIANETGLFDVSEGPFLDESLTLEQLGKFIAICLKWPLLIEDLEKNPKILAELQYLSVRRPFGDEKLSGSRIKLFSWDEINTIDRIRFDEYLSSTFGIYWIEKANIDYNIDKIQASYGNNFLQLILDNEKTKATKADLNINEVGKAQYEQFITSWENEKLNIYKNITDKALYWSNQQKLMELLRSGEPYLINSPASEQGRKYNISKLNITKLLQVSPRVARNASTPRRETFDKNQNVEEPHKDTEEDFNRLMREYENTSAEKKTLAVGESWNIGDGWVLSAQSIDARSSPRQVWLVLSKDGVKKDDKVVSAGDTYIYSEEKITDKMGIPQLVISVGAVFAGATSDMVQLILKEKKQGINEAFK